MSVAIRQFVSGISLTFALVAFAGCATTPPGEGRQHVNVLGIVEVKERSFEDPGNLTFAVSEGDLIANKEPTGRQVKLLWGLITYTDY